MKNSSNVFPPGTDRSAIDVSFAIFDNASPTTLHLSILLDIVGSAFLGHQLMHKKIVFFLKNMAADYLTIVRVTTSGAMIHNLKHLIAHIHTCTRYGRGLTLR